MSPIFKRKSGCLSDKKTTKTRVIRVDYSWRTDN
jgi:hypothetical protein